MNRKQLFLKKGLEFQEILEKWAKQRGLIKAGEKVRLRISVKPLTLIELDMGHLPRGSGPSLSWPTRNPQQLKMSDLPFSCRAQGAFRGLGLSTLEQVRGTPQMDFRRKLGCGEGTVYEIWQVLMFYNLPPTTSWHFSPSIIAKWAKKQKK